MEKKLFVGNLSFSVSETALEEAFSKFGTVESVRIITDRDSGRSKGFGFVEMASPELAQEAIAGLNEKEIEGRAISVSVAKPQAPRSDSRGGGGGGGGRGGNGGGSRRW